MTTRIDWFGLAEGVASDSRGNLTLVGFSPVFQVWPTLPATSSLILVLTLADDEDPEPVLVEGAIITMDIHIAGPDGARLVGLQQTTAVTGKKYPELPSSTLALVGVQLRIAAYGRYEANVTVGVTGLDEELTAKRAIYIVPQ